MAKAIGKERVGIRLSPYRVASGMAAYPEIDATYVHAHFKGKYIAAGGFDLAAA